MKVERQCSMNRLIVFPSPEAQQSRKLGFFSLTSIREDLSYHTIASSTNSFPAMHQSHTMESTVTMCKIGHYTAYPRRTEK